MSEPAQVYNNGGAILERLDGLRCDMATMSGRLDELSRGFNQSQVSYAAEHVRIVEQATAAHRRVDILESKTAAIEARVNGIEHLLAGIQSRLSVLVAIMGFVGVAIGGWLITQFLRIIAP
jgi:hypothetical protein